MSTKIVFRSGLQKSDPQESPVLIIGQVKHLTRLRFEDVKCKLEPRVSEETFKLAISTLHPLPTDSCSLYLNLATVAALPIKCSRHNTPSRSHAITRIVQAASVGTDECIVVVCERPDVYASACAIVRAFPLYSKKTSASNDTNTYTISVEFIIIPNNNAIAENNQFEGLNLTLQDISALEEAAVAIRMTARIVDTPCNEMSVDDFLEEVKSVGRILKITPTIIRDKELAEKGFGGIYGVGKGAAIPPALAVLSHTPEGAQKTIAWVGKGIVYDTGGLSLTKTSVPGMKRDCGGAAAILGAFYALVKADFTQNLHAVFCLADNSIGPNATKPDDIHTLYSGRTVEINNTDAEGRLVLADGVVFAQRDLKADVILDMATLTGAQAISTGKYHAAVVTNSGDWEDVTLKSGFRSGDLVFPLPYCPELHFSEFSSSVADMKNSVADRRNAQSSCAGLFIAAHLGFDFSGSWIHVDMAAPVHSGERATGYGVALLSTLFGSYSKQPLLQSIAPELEALAENVAKKPRKK